MPHMNRRTLLCAIAAAGLAATIPPPPAAAEPTGGSLPGQPVPPPAGVLTRLPPDGNQLALTVDDGNSVNVVGSLVQFCHDSGTRLTFFVNGTNIAWSVNAPALRPMVDSGQIALGNHTWSHPDITRLSPGAVADQISRNADFLRNTYGVDGTPYFRPPYGRHTAITDKVAADLGYATITMWSADIGDWRPENETTLIANAQKSFQPQQIVIGHANLPTVTHCYAQLLDIIQSRNLQTVTLNDVFT
ncbi:MAG: polysaccharide deacetylase family protein [Mycobacterium sp.]